MCLSSGPIIYLIAFLDILHITGKVIEVPTKVDATLNGNEVWTFTLSTASSFPIFKSLLVALIALSVLA